MKQELKKYMLADEDFNASYNNYKTKYGIDVSFEYVVDDTIEDVFDDEECKDRYFLDKTYLDIEWLKLSDGRIVNLDEVFEHFKYYLSI